MERPTLEVCRSNGWADRLRHAVRALLYRLREALPRRREPRGSALYLAASDGAPGAAPSLPPQIGSWKVLGVIATGTSATVYRVVPSWAPQSPDHYALKLHSARLAAEKDARSRFRREIRILKSLKHRNVVGMVEAGEFQGRLYIVMELVEGRNLRQALERQKPQLTGKLDWCIQIARALTATHRRGIVHRDLKPENILTTRVGVIKLADFGLAVQEDLQKITKAGFLVGTPAYMAPESLMGAEPDGRGDLYSLGVIMYEVFTGAMPFDAQSVSDFIDAHLNHPPIPPRRHVPSLPADLEAVVLKLLSKQPRDRYQSADEVRAALESVMASVVGVAPREARTEVA